MYLHIYKNIYGNIQKKKKKNIKPIDKTHIPLNLTVRIWQAKSLYPLIQ